MKLLRTLMIVIAASALATSCAPDPLEGFGGDLGIPDNNGGGDVGPGPGMDVASNNGGGTFNAEFLAVAQMLATNCGQAACHGPSPNGVFSMPAGVNATPAEVQAALSVSTPTVSGNRLIAPSNPDMSDIYVRMSSEQLNLVMPTTGARPPAEIEQVRAWIANGATYQ